MSLIEQSRRARSAKRKDRQLQILELLAAGPATREELAAQLRMDIDSTGACLTKLRKSGVVLISRTRGMSTAHRPVNRYVLATAEPDGIGYKHREYRSLDVPKRRPPADSSHVAGPPYYRGLNWSPAMRG